MARLISVNVGRPREFEWKGKKVRTAIWKEPVAGPVWIGKLHVEGDAQGDEQNHGGEQRAVFVYQLSSYRHWRSLLDLQEGSFGLFGENFTVEGLDDDSVCIGDRFRIGTGLFEVSQPRVTCYKIGIRLNHPELPALLVSHRRPGFYFRVLHEGRVAAGDEIIKVADGPQRMTVAQVDALLYGGDHPLEALERVLRIEALSVGWQGSFQRLLEAHRADKKDGNAGLTSVDAPPLAWEGFRALRVDQVADESEDVRSFSLVSLDGAPLPAGQPGQHIGIRFVDDRAAGSVTRFFSLSGAPDEGKYRISVKRAGAGSASDRLHRWARRGVIMEATAPRGSFLLSSGPLPVVLLSAGVGVTPMLSMLHALARVDRGEQRRVWWLHAARDGRHHAFKAEVRDLLQKLETARSHVAYSRPLGIDRVGVDFDASGRLGRATFDAMNLPEAADYYLCGPHQFLAEMSRILVERGTPANRIRSELFGSPGAAEDSDRPKPHQPAGAPGRGPLVTFARSGVSTPWDARYGSLLELAEACDVPTHWSCRSGVCQSCQSILMEGEVVYEPKPVASPASGTILLCCSRPRGALQLDL